MPWREVVDWIGGLALPDWLAIYAAALASGSAYHNHRKDRRARRPDVALTAGYEPGKRPYKDQGAVEGSYTVTVHSAEPVTVVAAGMARSPKRGPWVEAVDPMAELYGSGGRDWVVLPRTVTPGETLVVTWRESAVRDGGGDLKTSSTAWVCLSNTQRYTAGPVEWVPPVASRREEKDRELQAEARRLEEEHMALLETAGTPDDKSE